MRIAIGSDETNELTDAVVASVRARGHAVQQFTPAVWPTIARQVAEAVRDGRAQQGMLFCWTGTGTAMAANKVAGVRAALAWEPWIAEGARRWNDANVLVMSFKRTSIAEAEQILDAWFAVTEPDPDELENIALLATLDRPEATP